MIRHGHVCRLHIPIPAVVSKTALQLPIQIGLEEEVLGVGGMVYSIMSHTVAPSYKPDLSILFGRNSIDKFVRTQMIMPSFITLAKSLKNNHMDPT